MFEYLDYNLNLIYTSILIFSLQSFMTNIA